MISLHVLASQANLLGGADVYTRELVMRLPQRGLRTTLICLDADAEVQAACDTRIINRGNTNEWPVVWRLSPVLQLRGVRRAMARLSLDPPDVVLGMAHQLIWAHRSLYGPRPLIYLPHSMIAPIEVSSYAWGSSIKRALATWFWHRMERQCLNRAKRTVRFTQTACRALTEHYGAGIHPTFEVIPTAVDLKAQVPARASSGPVGLLWVGRLVETKNVQFLIQVLAGLRSANWVLEVLGDGPERPALEALVASLGLRDKVTFRGHVAPAPFYAQAELLLTASRMENAPLVIVEAMSYGVPTLAMSPHAPRYLNANDELIGDGRDGFLARDEPHFAVQLEALINSRPRLQAAGAEARRTAETRHSWKAHLDAYERMIQEIAREGGPQ